MSHTERQDVTYYSGHVIEFNGRRYAQERTCRNLSDDKQRFTCSECGAHTYGGSYSHSYVDDAGTRWYTTANKPGWNFCPNCGAKVVHDVDE